MDKFIIKHKIVSGSSKSGNNHSDSSVQQHISIVSTSSAGAGVGTSAAETAALEQTPESPIPENVEIEIDEECESTSRKKGRLRYDQIYNKKWEALPFCKKWIRPSEKVLDCQVSEWSQWSECDKSCGIGMMSRSRSILQPSQNGGKHCPSLVQKRGCQGLRCHGHHDRKVLREMALLLPAELSTNHHFNDSSETRRNLRLRYRASSKHNREHEYCVEYEVIKASKPCHKLTPFNALLEGDRIVVRCDLEAVTEDLPNYNRNLMGSAAKALHNNTSRKSEITNNSAVFSEDGEEEDDEDSEDYDRSTIPTPTTTTTTTTHPSTIYHCRGEGLSGRTTRWSALPAPSCRGKWLRLTVGQPKKCSHPQFIFV